MKKTRFSALTAALITACSLFAGPVFAADGGCEAKALDKNGKPLAGAAKTSFMKKCEGDSAGAGAGVGAGAGASAACAAKAVDKNGKALAGAAKTSFMKKCSADAAKK